ncbi:MAG: T9SS type A sorting domain-containing protein [Planctomycetota bacterium]
MKFAPMEIAAAITPGMPGETRTLTLTGNLMSGEPFAIQDCITLVGPKKDEPEIIMDSEPLLNPVYPNPFNPIAQISYSVPEETHVQLAIYNIKGELIKVLADEVVSSGEHTITWDAKDASSGVYFCRFMAGEFSQTRKMILLK